MFELDAQLKHARLAAGLVGSLCRPQGTMAQFLLALYVRTPLHPCFTPHLLHQHLKDSQDDGEGTSSPSLLLLPSHSPFLAIRLIGFRAHLPLG